MNQKQHAPGVQGRRAGALYQVLHKGKEIFLTHNEFRVYSLLMSGGKLATFDITEQLNIPIPEARSATCEIWESTCRTYGFARKSWTAF